MTAGARAKSRSRSGSTLSRVPSASTDTGSLSVAVGNTWRNSGSLGSFRRMRATNPRGTRSGNPPSAPFSCSSNDKPSARPSSATEEMAFFSSLRQMCGCQGAGSAGIMCSDTGQVTHNSKRQKHPRRRFDERPTGIREVQSDHRRSPTIRALAWPKSAPFLRHLAQELRQLPTSLPLVCH